MNPIEKILDIKLKNNDKYLINKILSYLSQCELCKNIHDNEYLIYNSKLELIYVCSNCWKKIPFCTNCDRRYLKNKHINIYESSFTSKKGCVMNCNKLLRYRF
jgi:hypothetical protein